jgi:hypothetical protein
MTRPDERWSPLLPPDEPAGARDYTVRAKVWRWKGGNWHFATLPVKQAARIRRQFGAGARGWGSIRVRVKIGDTEWNTSLFPERKSKSYLFAIKADVRKAEDIDEGDRITAALHIV